MEQGQPRTDTFIGETEASSESSSECSSRPSSPQQSQWAGSTVAESHSSPAFSSSGSVLDFGLLPDSLSHTSQAHLDYCKLGTQGLLLSTEIDVVPVHDTVICRLYETRRSSNIISPATAIADHIMTRPASARILLAISSLNRDIEIGYRTPSSDTLGLILEGIRLLKEQIQRPDSVSDDSILAVMSLWAYEVTLSMGSRGLDANSTQEQILPKSLTNNIQTHMNGLQRSIRCLGGLRNLSPETLWLLAW